MGAIAATVAQQLLDFHRLRASARAVPQARACNLAFYNDSKATNPEAAITALKAMESLLEGRVPVPALTVAATARRRGARRDAASAR